MNIKRMRGRGHRPGGNGGGLRHHNGGIPLNRNHVFDSNGPDVRLRGTAQQLYEKYLQLGRDASAGGDRVTAESCLQHAEHYFRMLSAINQAQTQGHPQHFGPRRLAEEEGEAANAEPPVPGTGEQPGTEAPREIPISVAPPEG